MPTLVKTKVKIKDLFAAIEKIENTKIAFNEFYNQNNVIKVKDENGNWIDVKALVKKKDRHVTLNDNLIVGFNHKFGNGKFARELNAGDTIPSTSGPIIISNKKVTFEDDVVYDWEVKSDTHLYQDANGIIHHNTGKSLFKWVFAAQTIRMGGLAYDIETEDATNRDFAAKIANDPTGEIVDRIQQVDGVDTLEKLNEFLVNIADAKIAKKNTTPVFVSVDSYSQLSSEKEITDTATGNNVRDMTKAQTGRAVFRTLGRKLSAANITLFLVCHTSMKIGGFGNPVTKASHGGGADFASSLTLWITSNKEIAGPNKNIPVGARMRFKVMKNRTVYKGRGADVVFKFNGSIQRYSGLFEILADYGVVELSSKEITSRTKIFLGKDGAPFESKKIKKNEVEQYEADGWTVLEDKLKADGTEKKNPSYKAVKGEEVSITKIKDWIAENGGEEKVITNWENQLNMIMEGIDPHKDDPEFFEEDDNVEIPDIEEDE